MTYEERFTLSGCICVCFLLASPGWRVFRLRRRNEDGSRVHLSGWLLSWFALSLLASISWICFYALTCESNRPPDDDKNKCPWRKEDLYMRIVIRAALGSNMVWLVYLCFIDFKKTYLCFAISAIVCLLVSGFTLAVEVCWNRVRVAGWMAILLATGGNVCRIVSIALVQWPPELSFYTLSVALAAVLPQIFWILNVILVEQYTDDAKNCGFHAVFYDKNFYWKLSWTVNSLIRLPELVALLMKLAVRCYSWIMTPARRLFGRRAAPLAEGQESSM